MYMYPIDVNLCCNFAAYLPDISLGRADEKESKCWFFDRDADFRFCNTLSGLPTDYAEYPRLYQHWLSMALITVKINLIRTHSWTTGDGFARHVADC
jgi:hypothetical protein